jgi:hypothetical protein
MHLTHSILYLIIGFLAGIITGAAIMAAWVMGWLLPVPSVDPRIGLDKK